jgi:argininosuccinate lyase
MPEPPQEAQGPFWQTRTGTPMHPSFAEYSQSLQDDGPYTQDDLVGCVAHVAGLAVAGLVEPEEAQHLIEGLQQLSKKHESGEWKPDPALEDIHMNIEAALQDECGDVALKLHTGRSRNDQVATALILHARRRLFALADALDLLTARLCQQALLHTETAWTARTHGQAAQPATLGYLLAAHAVRTDRLAAHTLTVIEEIEESPLGGGAVAGSTLPLQAEVPAALLALQPLENALVATGTRDHLIAALSAVTRSAGVLGSLAVDLLQLHQQGQYTPPQPFTTGSSLMPHKRNPDALELARAHAQSLPTHLDATLRITGSLGLGYQRDLQLVKPHLANATTNAIETTKILEAHITQGSFQPLYQSFEARYETQAICATDAVEALVTSGIAFRAAYQLLAKAAHESETHQVPLSETLPAILKAHDVRPSVIKAALDSLSPDPQRRATRGGPATTQVKATIQRIGQRAKKRQPQLQQAEERIRRSLSLLLTGPSRLLEQSGSASPTSPLPNTPST